MAQEFLDDPQHPGDRVWRRSSWGAIGSGTLLVLCAGLGVAMTVVLVMLFFNGALLLRMDDRERSEIPVGRAVAPRLRELFWL